MSLLRLAVCSFSLLAFLFLSLPSSFFTAACPVGSKSSSLDFDSSPVYHRSDASSKIRTAVGSSFVLELASNPTTGYSWQVSEGYTLEENSPGLQVNGCEYVRQATAPGQPQLMGAGGVERWVFVAKEAGEQLVPLQYARPWEKEDNYKADPTLVFTVEVAAAASSSDPSQAKQASVEAEEAVIQDLVEAELAIMNDDIPNV